MKKKEKVYVLCDTTEIPSYDSYVEYCKDCLECEPSGENSEGYWNYVSHMNEMEYDSMRENMTYSEQCQCPVIITGELGLWNGKHEIYPMHCNTLYDAILRCSRNADSVKVEYQDGAVRVYSYHHDGCNVFMIHKLSKRGEIVCSKWENGISSNIEVKGYWFAKFHGFLY